MDRPYVYVYDSDALADGLAYNDLSVPLHSDSDFLLRRIAGRPEVTATGVMQVRGDRRNNLFSAPIHLQHDQAVVPELLYRAGSVIGIDLTASLRANNPEPAVPGGLPSYFSQLCFQGVRRFATGKPVGTSYRYYEKPYAWVDDIVVTWPGRILPGMTVVDNGRRFSVPVQDDDFALHYVAMTQQRNGGTRQPCHQSVKIMLYNSDGDQLMSAPVCDFFLNAGGRNYNSLFPVPPLVYPAGSQILYDVYSLLDSTMVPCNLEMAFCGARRIPC
jgi:hypothetical protein